MPFFHISPEAFQVASTFTIFSVFSLGFVCIWTILCSEFKRKKLTLKTLLQIFEKGSPFQIPGGFLLILLGLMVRYITAIPKSIYIYNGMYTQLLRYNEIISPWITSITEMMVYIGACIIFWPSIQIATMYVTGSSDPKIVQPAAVFLAMLFKIFITICGLLLFYSLAQVIT